MPRSRLSAGGSAPKPGPRTRLRPGENAANREGRRRSLGPGRVLRWHPHFGKKPTRGQLSTDQLAFNSLHAALGAIGERANTLLKATFKALRRVSLDPSRIGDIVGGALVLLHIEHNRTT